MHRQVFEPHENRHAKAEPEQAEQDSDEQQLVTVDGTVKKADQVQLRQLQCSFSATLAGRLCERRSRAHSEQRNYGRGFHRHAAECKRSSGKPGTHMSPPY